MDFEILGPLRAVTEPIDRIINCVMQLVYNIFAVTGNGAYITDASWMNMLVRTILNNNYLLISVSLLIIGFVIGILRRMIHE